MLIKKERAKEGERKTIFFQFNEIFVHSMIFFTAYIKPFARNIVDT